MRAMTPLDLMTFIDGWNEAQGGDDALEPPTQAQFDELVRKYG